MQISLSLPRWLHLTAIALATSVQPLVAPEATAQQPPATEPVPAVIAAQSGNLGDAEVGDADEEGSALLRGPVHEAFAEQFSMNVTPSEVLGKEPPQPIDEVPPEFRPEGENIQWIPGYWGWDIESEDFVWVTGVWRAVPPDQQWIPGYWTQAEDGWQWVSGFWTSAQTEQFVYMPLPPESIEAGPSVPAPGDDYFWIPGSWQYDQTQNTQNQYSQNPYNWQAGYWSQGHDDWVWIPSRYVWTPSGCIYREGYWDYVVQSRGTIFCPMAFRSGYRQQFRPRYVVETGPLWLANLFVLPGLNQYAFGNYYGYRGNRQIYPWVNYYQSSRGYDPLFSYYAYQNRNTNLIRQIARVERQIANNPVYRAQPTVAGQLRALNNLQGPQANWALRAVQLNALATQSNLDFDTPFQFASIDADRRTQLVNAITPARELAQQRRELEQASTREDRQRAVRADARGDARADTTAENRDRAQADWGQAGNRGESRPDDKDEVPNAGAAVSGNVKRLAIRAEGGANGQRRLAQADPQSADRPSTNAQTANDGRADRAGKNTTASSTDRASDADRPNADRPNAERPNPDRSNPDRSNPDKQATDKPANETDNAKRKPGASEDKPGTNADLTPGRTSDSVRPRTQAPSEQPTPNQNPANQNPTNQNPTNQNPNTPGTNARDNNRANNPGDRSNPNGRDRTPSPNNPLDRFQQGLDDKNSPNDAKALREMMRRAPRTGATDNPNTNNPGRGNPNQSNPATAGDLPNRNSAPSANDPTQPNRSQPNAGQPNAGQPNAGQPNAGQPDAGQNRNPLGNAPGIRPPSLPRQNPAAGAPGRDNSPSPAARPPRGNPAGPGSTPNPGARPNANPGGNPGLGSAPGAGRPGGNAAGNPSGNAGGNRGGNPPVGNRATGSPAGGNPPAAKAPAGNAAHTPGRAAGGNPAGRPGGNNRSEGRPNKDK